MNEAGASFLQLLGAGAFGALIGWYAYFVNRYRTDAIRVTDVVAMVSAIGGAAVLTLFPAKTDLFAAYGIGLFLGFFGYFVVLLVLVSKSEAFDLAWFLDGRRKAPRRGEVLGGDGGRAMVAGTRD